MAARYRLALFDFDGTLADSFPLFSEAFNTLAARHGFRPVAGAEARELRTLHAREIMKRVDMPAWKLPIVARDFVATMRARRREVATFPGTDAMLAALQHAGLQLALVSSNDEDNVKAVLGEAASARIAHFACGMSIFGKRRPLRAALEALRVPAGEAIYIADQAADLEAARAEGIATGAVTWGYGDAAHLATLGPDHLFTRMEAIAPTLAGRS